MKIINVFLFIFLVFGAAAYGQSDSMYMTGDTLKKTMDFSYLLGFLDGVCYSDKKTFKWQTWDTLDAWSPLFRTIDHPLLIAHVSAQYSGAEREGWIVRIRLHKKAYDEAIRCIKRNTINKNRR